MELENTCRVSFTLHVVHAQLLLHVTLYVSLPSLAASQPVPSAYAGHLCWRLEAQQ